MNKIKNETKYQMDDYKFGFSVSMVIFTIIFLIAILTTSCSASKDVYIMRSNVVVTSENQKIIYIKDDSVGSLIYKHWQSGCYGNDYIPVLVTDHTFMKLSKLAKANNN